MFILKLNENRGWHFSTTYYEYDNEAQAVEVARELAAKGVSSTLLKPYKKFERPVPEVVEVNV